MVLGNMPQSIQVHTLYKPTLSLALGVVDGKTKSIIKWIC